MVDNINALWQALGRRCIRTYQFPVYGIDVARNSEQVAILLTCRCCYTCSVECIAYFLIVNEEFQSFRLSGRTRSNPATESLDWHWALRIVPQPPMSRCRAFANAYEKAGTTALA